MEFHQFEPAKAILGLYFSVQPTVRQVTEDVVYQEFLPDPRLRNLIYCYWQLKTVQVLDAPFTYRVVADGCIDIFFEMTRPEGNFVMGFCKNYTEFPLDRSFHYVGVRFLPTVFPQLYGVNAAELSNRYEHLSNVAPDTAAFIASRFTGSESPQDIAAVLDLYFLALVDRAKFDFDSRLYDAIHLILIKQGVLNVESDLKTGISERQLRRLFKYYIGDTAKTFSQVVRFQHVLRAKPSIQSLRQNKLFFDHGYYDQAHFIKAFKTFYGVTPGKAFGRP